MNTNDYQTIKDLIARCKEELQPTMDVIAALEAALAAAQAGCAHDYQYINLTPRFNVLRCEKCLQVINER